MDIQRISLERLKNTRDLGGFKTADGRRIKPGRLIRSGELSNASASDIQVLVQKYGLCKIVDFRTAAERAQNPDPEILGVEYIVNPIVREETLGITRQEEGMPDGMAQMAALVASGDFDSKTYMACIYRKVVSDEYSRGQYKKFFEILLENTSGAVLWHCSAGKDRVGVGTALLLTALSVPENVIIEDYMRVNEFVSEDIERMISGILKGEGNPEHRAHLRTMFMVDASYIKSVFETIDAQWGSRMAFLEKEMGLDAIKLQRLRENYLEPV